MKKNNNQSMFNLSFELIYFLFGYSKHKNREFILFSINTKYNRRLINKSINSISRSKPNDC